MRPGDRLAGGPGAECIKAVLMGRHRFSHSHIRSGILG